MSPDISHERCSELLPAHLDGSLDRAAAEAVRAHLGSCERCRDELAGLEALRSAPSGAMTEAERARLHAAVGAALEGSARVVRLEPRADRSNRWRAGAVRVFGAAAALAFVAGLLYLGGGIVGDDSGEALRSRPDAVGDREQDQAGGGDSAGAGGGGTVEDEAAAEEDEERAALTEDEAGYQAPSPGAGEGEEAREEKDTTVTSESAGGRTRGGRESTAGRIFSSAGGRSSPAFGVAVGLSRATG